MHRKVTATLKGDKWFITGAAMGGLMALIALVGPYLVPYNPQEMSFQPFARPSWEHPLGVNDGGQDILSELVHGVRNSLSFGAIVGGLALILAVGVGLVASWYDGVVGKLLMSCADIFMAIPSVMILILVAALFQPSATVLALVLAGLSWPTTAKAVRAQALVLRDALHVRAAVQMGGSAWYIMTRHLVPETFPLYLVGFVAKARMAVFTEASLGFLGLFDPERKSLGEMIHYALRYYYMDTWWNWLFPAVLCLSVSIMAAGFMAISLERVLDPRLRSLWG